MAWIGGAISAGAGLLGGLFGGDDDKQQQVSNEPWGPLQPYLKSMYERAGNLPLQRPYPYQTYAPRSPLTDASQRAQVGYATNYLPGLFAGGNEALAAMLAAPDVATNPYVQRQIAAQNQQIGDQLQRQWLPSIRSGASQAGQYGGTRQGIAEGLAMGEASKAAQQAAVQTQLGAYGQGLDQQARGVTFLPQQAQLGMLPAQIYGQVGAAQEGYNDKMIQDSYNRWMFQQQAPYTQLAAQSAALQGMGNYGTSTTTGGGSSPWATGLGTAASVYGLGQNAGWWGGQSQPSMFGNGVSALFGGLGTTPFSQQSLALANQLFG